MNALRGGDQLEAVRYETLRDESSRKYGRDIACARLLGELLAERLALAVDIPRRVRYFRVRSPVVVCGLEALTKQWSFVYRLRISTNYS